MQEIAASAFQDNLRGTAGVDARNYVESRGVSKASMDEFRIGLSDSSGQQLVQRLQKFGSALIEESGLIGKREDRFRARLMFPIHDAGGKVIGFGGRALRPDDNPKYMNSPATKLYNKSTVLYNLHRAKIEARKHDRMILVEGYMDVIGVYAAGIKEVVASSGTSFGPEQVRMIRQQTGSGYIILNFDSDKAGAGATEKYITPCLAEGLRVKILEIPGGLDPDEYIQQNGADSYRKLLDSAGSCFHWLADRARNKFDTHTAEGRVDAFKFIWPSIQQMHDRLERSAIANEMAEYLKVDREVIRQEFKRAPKAEPPQRPRTISSAVAPNEKLLLTCLLASAEARVAIRHYLANSGDFLAPLELRGIFELIVRFDETSRPFSMETISGGLEPRLQRILAEIGFSELGIPEEGAAEQALQCLRALEAKATDARRETLRRQVRELEQSGNFTEAMRLAEELNTLKRSTSGA
jgi:DNA primase